MVKTEQEHTCTVYPVIMPPPPPNCLRIEKGFVPNMKLRKWEYSHFPSSECFLCPRHKMAMGHLVFALSVLPSFRPSVPSKIVFSTPPTSLHGSEWNLAGMLHHKSRSACGEIIHVRQILAELWSLTLWIFTHFSLSSQLLLHPCMDLNETWQGCCTTSLEVHVGRLFMFDKFWQSYGPWHLEKLYTF